MKRIAYLLAAGVALLSVGASAGQGAPPRAYMIAQLNVRDTKAYADYAPKVPPVIAKFGGRYVVRGGKFTAVEGQSRSRNVVIEFDSYEQALACYNSPEYQANIKVRQPHSTADLIIIEGYDGPQP